MGLQAIEAGPKYGSPVFLVDQDTGDMTTAHWAVRHGVSFELWGTMRYAVKAIPAPKLSLQPKMDTRSRRPTPGGTNPCWSRRLLRRRSSSRSRFSNAAVRKSTFLQVGCPSLSR